MVCDEREGGGGSKHVEGALLDGENCSERLQLYRGVPLLRRVEAPRSAGDEPGGAVGAVLDEGKADAGCAGVGEDNRAQGWIEMFDDCGGCEEVFEGVEFVIVLGGPNPGDVFAKQDAEFGACCRQVRQVRPQLVGQAQKRPEGRDVRGRGEVGDGVEADGVWADAVGPDDVASEADLLPDL